MLLSPDGDYAIDADDASFAAAMLMLFRHAAMMMIRCYGG